MIQINKIVRSPSQLVSDKTYDERYWYYDPIVQLGLKKVKGVLFKYTLYKGIKPAWEVDNSTMGLQKRHLKLNKKEAEGYGIDIALHGIKIERNMK